LLVSAAAKPGADHALVVATALLRARHQQRLFRFLLAVGDVREVADGALAAAGGDGFVLTDAHVATPCLAASFCARSTRSQKLAAKRLKELDLVLAVQFDDGLFPVRHFAHTELVAALFAWAHLSANFQDADAEQLLDGVPDLVLGRPEVDFERV